MYNPKKNGKRLKNLRQERNLTQEQVAKVCKLSHQAIAAYENGTRNPTDETKIRLAKLYKRSVEEIFFAPITHKMRS